MAKFFFPSRTAHAIGVPPLVDDKDLRVWHELHQGSIRSSCVNARLAGGLASGSEDQKLYIYVIHREAVVKPLMGIKRSAMRAGPQGRYLQLCTQLSNQPARRPRRRTGTKDKTELLTCLLESSLSLSPIALDRCRVYAFDRRNRPLPTHGMLSAPQSRTAPASIDGS